MFERRKTYRVPFRTKFIFSMPRGVFVGNTVDLSEGGVFIQSFETDIAPDTPVRCTILLGEGETPVTTNAIIKRVVPPTTNPEDIPGLGFAFQNTDAVKERLHTFMDECYKNYKVVSAILSYGEPDIMSLEPLMTKMHLPPFMDLGELKFHVEHILKAIDLVIAKTAPKENLKSP